MRENQLMRKTAIFAVMLALVAGVALAQSRDKKNDATRVLTGRVIDKQDNPLPNAVVYLTNTQSRATKTYIHRAINSTLRPAALSGRCTAESSKFSLNV